MDVLDRILSLLEKIVENSCVVKVKTLPHFKGELPKYETDGASGMDVRAQIDGHYTILGGRHCLIPTGISVAVPRGYEIQARSRSGLALKRGLMVLNSPGTIDSDYRGEIGIILKNTGTDPVRIDDQDRIAQIVLCPVVKMTLDLEEELDNTTRGSGAFGSTGQK
jgi:dUTP pyrophosphatase